MDVFLYISILIFIFTTLLLPIILWPSMKNTNFYQAIPGNLIAYILGGMYFIHEAEKRFDVNTDTEEIYAYILLLGCISYVVAFCLGFYTKSRIKSILEKYIKFLCNNNICNIKKKSMSLAIITIVLFIITYAGMGFIPAFAEDPMVAKYMGGEYQELYRNYAIPFRIALGLSYVSVILMILSIIDHDKKGKLTKIFLLICLGVCVALTMRRAQILSGVIAFAFSYLAFAKKYIFLLLVVGYISVFMFGSAANAVFLYMIGIGDGIEIYDVLRGMPDVSDQLMFLHRWINDNWEITMGSNIIGGMIPFHSKYNISALTLYVVGATPGETASGGFRLLTPMIGFISFSWIGVIIITGISAYLNGMILRITKDFTKDKNREDFIIINTLLIPCTIGWVTKIVESVGIDAFAMAIMVSVIFIISNYKVGLKIIKK